MSAGVWIAVALLGGLGATLRHVLDAAVARRTPHTMPYGIFVVNVTGAFALGLLAGSGAGGDTLRIVGTGLLGAYTTFSTWMLQVHVMLRDGRRRAATTYLAGSLLVGLLALWGGRSLVS